MSDTHRSLSGEKAMDRLGYPDLHAHIAALERQGHLVRVQRPINKDTEMHPLVRWQFRGGIPEAERKAFLFENVIDSKGRRFDIPVAVGILASNREIYSAGLGCKVEDIKAKWDHAEQHPLKPEPVDHPPCQEVVIEGNALNEPGRGVDALPIPISTPGFDNAPYASCSMFITKDPDTGRQNIGNYRAMVKSPTRVGMNPEIELNQGIHEHWLKYKARGEKMPAVLMLGAPPAITFASVHKLPKHLDELAVAGGLVGAPIRVCRAKTVDLIVPAEAEIVIEGFIDTEWLRAGRQLRRIARLHESEGVQRLHGRHRDHAAPRCRAGLDHQPSDAERIEPDQARRLRAGVPASSASPSQHQRRHPRVHARAADQLAQAHRDPDEVGYAGSGSLARAVRRFVLFVVGRQDDHCGQRGHRPGKSRHGDVGPGLPHAPA